MSASRLALEVRVGDTRVGLLHRNRDGLTSFTPDASWMADDQRPPLGYAMLVDPGRRSAGTGLPTWFENLLPEHGSALRLRLCRAHGLRESDSAGLLRVLGGDLPGAVVVSGGVEDSTEAAPSALPDDGKLRFSLAGMQLKFSMVFDQHRFALPARAATGSWIVKLPGGLHELPAIEHATMSWAHEMGLEVPPQRVVPVTSLDGVDIAGVDSAAMAFAIERFDRRADGSRVHQEDFAQVLEVSAADKYRGTSYDQLARLVGDACGAAARDDFIARLAFIVASGNGDAHLKNWSFQWGSDHRPRLSPCYDMVATITWPQFGESLALSLGRTRRFAALDRARLERFATRANAPHGVERFMAALEASRDAWPAVADQVPTTMLSAIIAHWERVPLLRAVGSLAHR